jgi:hypothetical protein
MMVWNIFLFSPPCPPPLWIRGSFNFIFFFMLKIIRMRLLSILFLSPSWSWAVFSKDVPYSIVITVVSNHHVRYERNIYWLAIMRPNSWPEGISKAYALPSLSIYPRDGRANALGLFILSKSWTIVNFPYSQRVEQWK